MHLRGMLPLQPGSAGLSKLSQGVVKTLALYGGDNGIILGGTRLNQSINGTGNQDTNSVIVSLTGCTPGIFKWMWLDPTQDFYAGQGITAAATADYEAGIAACIAHWEAGGIITMGLMSPNFVTGGDWADRERSNITPVTHLKLGSPNATALAAWYRTLDKLAYTLKTRLVDRFGNPIPVIIHWFGECNGYYDFRRGEGLYPATQVEGRTITAMQRVSGQSYYQFTFQARAGDDVPPIPGPGSPFQVEGAASSSWNGCYNTYQWLSGPAGDAPGTGQTVTITAWRGAGRPNNTGVADVSAGTTVAYPANGAWPAGLDRAADLMIVFREAVDYLIGTMGVTNMITSMAPFPEQYWSTKEGSTTAGGLPLLYSNWGPGQSYIRVGGANVYRPNSSPTIDTTGVSTSLSKWRSIHGFKPFILNELGFAQESETSSTSAAFRAQTDFWPREWGRMRKACNYVSAACIWSSKFIPRLTDPALQGFADMVRSDACITLERLNRQT